MIQFFRSFFQSRIGVGITLGFLVLMAFAFASADISGSGTFGGVGGGEKVATVGNRTVTTSALSQAATSGFDAARQENPRLSMKAFIAAGGLDQTLDQLLDRTALSVFGEKHGIVAGSRLVDSEIAAIPAFKGIDGKFSEAAYKQLIQQRGLSDAVVREDLASGLVARQVLVPASFGAVFPQDMAVRYAALLRERRLGAVALIPSAAFAPAGKPTDAQIAAHYAATRDRYIRPERRVIRYFTFGDAVLKTVPAPTDAEIAARYEQRKADYAASESRRLTQLIVPTEAAARAILAEVARGTTLDRAASSKGLGTAAIGPIKKEELASQSAAAVADAAFAAPRGGMAALARSGLGWHIIRVDAVEARAARSLADVRAELVTQLAAEKRRAALLDFTARIEEEFDNGGNLADVARELGVTPQLTAPITGDGQVYGKPGETAPPILARAVQAAFAMERENQPQLTEIEAGKTFLVFDVTQITASAPAPLAEVKDAVAVEYLLAKGATGARAAADKVVAATRKGADLAAAMAALGKSLPPVDRIEMSRPELMARGQQVPPPLALLFSMAEGTVKLLPAPQNRGWYVVALKDIVPGEVPANDPLIAQARRELGGVAGQEYASQLRRAIRAEAGIKRNATAIAAVRKQLDGSN